MKQETQKSWCSCVGSRLVWLLIVIALILAGWGTFRLFFSSDAPEINEVQSGDMVEAVVLPDASAEVAVVGDEATADTMVPNDPGEYE